MYFLTINITFTNLPLIFHCLNIAPCYTIKHNTKADTSLTLNFDKDCDNYF